MLQRFLVIVTTNIWILHCYNISRNCYNLFILLHRLFDVTILLQQLYVVTILLHRIACNCYNVFATGCNNGIFHCYACYNAMLQAFQTPHLISSETNESHCWFLEMHITQLREPVRLTQNLLVHPNPTYPSLIHNSWVKTQLLLDLKNVHLLELVLLWR